MTAENITVLLQLDTRLAVLGRGVGAMRLRIGEGLSKLESLGGIHALGFPTLESYAREALGRSGRWGGDARALARRLEALPTLRAALISGALTTSMVELVARVATPDDDATWVARAQQMTVRQMRVHLKRDRRLELEDDTPLPRSTISVRVTQLEALAFERARAIVEAVGATRGPGGIDPVEAMLAEGLGELLARDPDIDLPTTIGGDFIDEGAAAERAALSLMREERESAVESAVPPEEVDPIALELAAEPEPATCDDVAGVDRALRFAALELARRDVELAELAARAEQRELWRILRFASFDHYCRERIGLSPTSIGTRITLAGRMAELPQVAEALMSGRIGYAAATLVARVASPLTVHAWVERAAERTVKHLQEEVDAVHLVARLERGDLRRVGPPDSDMLEAARSVERAALRIVTGQLSNSQAQPLRVGINELSEGAAEPEHMSGTALEAAEIDLPTTTLRLSLSDDVARFWRGLEGVHQHVCADTDSSESFVAFLVRTAAASWSGTVDAGVAYADIYERDRWRCASPICRSRNVTPHHIVFRSHGGGEAPGNLVSLCERCHLELVHLGHLSVTGDATVGLQWRADGWDACARSHRQALS